MAFEKICHVKLNLFCAVEEIVRFLDKGKGTDLIIMDLSKAIDSVPHQRLLMKLRYYAKSDKCNFIIQIHKFTIKIDTISINLLFECVQIVDLISIPTCFLSCIKRYFL